MAVLAAVSFLLLQLWGQRHVGVGPWTWIAGGGLILYGSLDMADAVAVTTRTTFVALGLTLVVMGVADHRRLMQLIGPGAPRTSDPLEVNKLDVNKLDVNKLVHEPDRLAILSVLDGSVEVDFLFLQTMLGLTKGDLSSHLSKLEDGGLVSVRKEFKGRTPRTILAITEPGREALAEHWAQMEAIRRLSGRG